MEPGLGRDSRKLIVMGIINGTYTYIATVWWVLFARF